MGVFAFPRSHHLKKPSDFRAVFDRGAKRHSRGFIVFRLPTDQAASRLGVSVSRKIGGAVVRNRVKRLLREAFRLGRDAWHLEGSDVVVVAKRGAEGLSVGEVARELSAALTPRRGR